MTSRGMKPDWAEEMLEEWIAAYRMDYDILAFLFVVDIARDWSLTKAKMEIDWARWARL